MISHETPKDYLILGGSSLLGRQLYQSLGSERATATYCHTAFQGGIAYCPLQDNLLGFLDNRSSFDFGIILFAETRIDVCAQNSDEAELLNVKSTIRVIDALRERDIMPVFVSSDMVFDGENGRYKETDLPQPILTYGRMKLDVERYLEASDTPYLIVRLSKVFSKDPLVRTQFSDWRDAIVADEQIYCATDQKFCPIDIRDAVDGLKALMERGTSGLYHLAGPDVWTRANLFAALVAELRRYCPEISTRVEHCSIRDFDQFAEIRPLDISLDSSKFIAATGYEPRDIRETCRAFAKAVYSK